jgi:uncharacterized protein YndB with AHSA1/START domain
MEYGSIEREIHVEAPPEVVFEVISSPEHLQEWWPDEAVLESSAPGAEGQLIWGDEATPRANVVPMIVVEAEPPRLFSFRWAYDAEEVARVGNSMLVTFELTPAGGGTTLKMTEVGFREMGWEAAVLEAQYQDHVDGWGFFLPRLVEYAARLVASR